MEHVTDKPHSAHQELSLLLPWYVNKTLQGTELLAVEQHLSVCLTCKRELTQLQKLAKAVAQEGTLDSAEQVSFSRLKKRLHSGREPIAASTILARAGKAKKPAWSNNAMPRPALALAAVLLLSLLIPRYVGNDLNQGNAFRTLSDAQQEAIGENEIKNEIRVVFADVADQRQKDKIVERIHGKFIDNPTAQGVYTVRLDKDMATKHLLDVVELLRKDTAVIFAEPAYALLSSSHSEK